ncbi:MAG: DUF3800 domain-containing protein [Bifidobacteriaceae bacterium]|nr:DUF3800 domain-containing protein [Bifidobacteriaceae bacterium]
MGEHGGPSGWDMVFLDDAGDPGFKFDRGSSSHFVIAAVRFQDRLAAEETALVMKRYRRAQGWRDDHEFKFTKLDKGRVKELLGLVAGCDYRINAVRVDKALIRSGELRAKPESFYNYIVMQALDQIPGLLEADVRLDGHAGREYKQSAIAYFRRQLNSSSRKVARFRFVDSRGNNLIQLADLAAGSIHRAVQDKTDAAEYVRILAPRIEEIWDFH